MADVRSASALDIAANRVAAARISDQSHSRGAGAAFQLLNGLAELSALVFARGLVGLWLGVVGTRQRIGKIDRKHPLTRYPVRLHPPRGGDPKGGVVAIAVHEQNGRKSSGGRAGRSRLCERRRTKIPG